MRAHGARRPLAPFLGYGQCPMSKLDPSTFSVSKMAVLGQVGFEGRGGQVFSIAEVGLMGVEPAETDAGQGFSRCLD